MSLRRVAALAAFVFCANSLLAAASGGFLTGAFSPIAAGSNVNLSAEGPADWAHWGLYTETSFNHKANVTPQIANYTVIGNRWAGAWPYGDNFNGYSWSNGVPEAQVEDTPTGVYVAGLGNGFELRAPASTNRRTLKVFVGAYGAQGRFEASLSDRSGPTFIATNISNIENGPGGVYTLYYASAGSAEMLVVNYTVSAMHVTPSGNVTLQAAALTVDGVNVTPNVSLVSPAPEQTFYAPANVFCKAIANDPDGSIVGVEFFSGTNWLWEADSPPYTNTWSDLPAGTYELFARAIDDAGAVAWSSPVRFHVINSGGNLSGCVSAPAAKVDLTRDGQVDWAHWGYLSATSFDHKSNVTQQISAFRVIGGGSIEWYANNFSAFSWSDGVPNINVTDTTTGVFVGGIDNGFEITIPAENTRRRLNLYVGLYGARSVLDASLSDSSAAPFRDSSLSSIYGDAYGVYGIDFAAASSNQILRVTYKAAQLYDPDYGNVTLQAATLADLSGAAIYNPRCVQNQFHFDILTESNRSYTVQWSESSSFPNWNILTNVVGDGTIMTISDPGHAGGQRFYRLR